MIGLLQAASLLLIPNLVEACGSFLARCLDPSNCLTILATASADFGDSLVPLKKEAIRYIQLHFEDVWQQLAYDFEASPSVESEDDSEGAELMDHLHMTALLSSDDLCVQSEENVFTCLQNWLLHSSARCR